MDIKGFQSFSAVRDKKSGGGFYLGIRHGLYESVMIDSDSKASFVTVCLNWKNCSVRLILVYGSQENDSEDKDSFYHDISVQAEMAYLNGDSIIMVGDLNAKLGYDRIPNDLHPILNNGEQLFELCNKYNLKVMNASEHCEGVFTRKHKCKQTIEKSVLHYGFISSDLEEYFTSMQIDEEKHFTPWRSLKHSKRYSDYCAVKFCMTMKAFEQKQASEKLRSGTSMILRVGKSLINLQNPSLFSVICGKLVTILKLVTKNARTIWIGYYTYALEKENPMHQWYL